MIVFFFRGNNDPLQSWCLAFIIAVRLRRHAMLMAGMIKREKTKACCQILDDNLCTFAAGMSSAVEE